jgi:hypothetical protein
MVSVSDRHRGVGHGETEVEMHEDAGATWSLGEVVYLAWLAVIALAWVVLPMALVLAGR